MNVSMRRIAKDVAIYGAGNVLLRATAIITMPIYTRIFTVDDYGVLSAVLTIIGLLGTLLVLGGDAAYLRFYFEAKNLEERQLVTSSWFAFLALWSCLVIAICLPFSGFFSNLMFGTTQYGNLFTVALLTAPVTLMNVLLGQVLRNQFRARAYSVLNVVTTLLTIAIGFFAVVALGMGLAGVLIGTLAAALLLLPVRLWTARGFLRPVFSPQIVRRMLGFGLPIVPASIAVWVFMSSDRIVLSKVSSLDQLGLFAVATSVASILVLVNGAVSQAWAPYTFQIYEDHPDQASEFFGRVMTYLLIGFGILVIGVTAFSELLLRILAAPAFFGAAAAVGPLALGIMAYATTCITSIGISLAKKTKYSAMACWLAAIVNLGLNLLLVPQWGMLGSAWATTISYTCLTVTYLLIAQRLFSITYETRRALTTVALTVAFTLGVSALPTMSFVQNIAVSGLYTVLFIVALVVGRVLGAGDWAALASLIPGRGASVPGVKASVP